MAMSRLGPGNRRESDRNGLVRRFVDLSSVLDLLTAACGAGASLTLDEQEWCLGNAGRVKSAATDLGLPGFIDACCEKQGNGVGPGGQPVVTDRNVAVAEGLRTGNAADTGAILYDLFSRHLRHPDGQTACRAASTGNV
jgi:hypothetical protein